jgi:hypothetical protein
MSQITNEHHVYFPLTRCLQKSTSDMQRNVDKSKPCTRMHSDASHGLEQLVATASFQLFARCVESVDCIAQPSLSLTHPLDGSWGASLGSGQSAATCIVQCR